MRIRLLDHRDAYQIQKLASSEYIAETTNVPHPYPSNGGINFVEHALANYASGESMPFCIEYESELVGIVTINNILNTPSIDYWIGRPYWGKGLATFAVGQAIDYAVQYLNITKMITKALKHNIGSHRVLTKNGFIFKEEKTYVGPKDSYGGEIIYVFELNMSSN